MGSSLLEKKVNKLQKDHVKFEWRDLKPT